MAAKKTPKATDGLPPTSDYRHDSKRTNIPSAKISGEGQIPKAKKVHYAYSPHLDPVLRFDPTGRADKVAGIVEKACSGKALNEEEKGILRAVGKNWEQPWLEWAGKQEEHARGTFAADPVALHIHERISAQAILRQAMRKDVEPSLFGNREQSYAESLQFYKHRMDWANRLILGDSLQVMSSLAHREDLAGKVQMIYMDPPYGIRFSTNFQTETGRRDLKDGRDQDLTREAEMVRAFRDTWHLGTSSYLSYLRDRLIAARRLLSGSGSVFVQIGDENVHRVRAVLDEVLGDANFVAMIYFQTAANQNTKRIQRLYDVLLWYKGRGELKFRNVFRERDRSEVDSVFTYSDEATGEIYKAAQIKDQRQIDRLRRSERLVPSGAYWKRYLSDFPYVELDNVWYGTVESTFSKEKVYVVQTTRVVIERCMLLSTDPGDLVLDPTCGSGTTATVAEQWGRRWITIDTSRVAVAIARQRLLTSKFDHYRTKAGPKGPLGDEDPSSGFSYKKVPHITFGSIADNGRLDSVFAKHDSILVAKLSIANNALLPAAPMLRQKAQAKMDAKVRSEGKQSVTEADRRRWILPPENRDLTKKLTVDAKFAGWYEWEVPLDTDPDWPKPLQDAVLAYRKAWRAKMDEVNQCIADNAKQEELVNQPEVVKGVARVSGPFTVEGVIPEELSLTEDGVQDLTPNEFADDASPRTDEQNAEAYLAGMLREMQRDGVLFLGNQKKKFSRVEPLYGTGNLSGLHAEAAWEGEDDLKVAIAFGPQYGPVTAQQVETLIRASRRYEHLVIAAFSFAPEASAIISESPHPKLQIHMAHIRPDMNPAMQGLLKETPNSQLFTVFGLPAVSVTKQKDGDYTVELEGVDIYDPVENTVRSTKAEKVAAWFLDSDFDGRCFCVCQAFFPHQDAWEKIAKALKSDADPEAFEAFKGTVSLPFKKGKHATIAVKVIDPRGNEVMAVRKLEG